MNSRTCFFSKWKNLFGKPYEGIHAYRIFDVSVIDVSVVVASGFLISYFTQIAVLKVLIVSFLLGIIVHRLLCVRTRFDRWIFVDAEN